MRLFVDLAKLGFQVSPLLIGGNDVPCEVFFVILDPVFTGAEAGTPISCGTAYGLTFDETDTPFRIVRVLLFQGIVSCGHTYAAGSDYHQIVHLFLH